MSAPSFEITAKQFAQLVRPVVPLAAADGMLPILNAVHFYSAGDYLVASATDRFRLGIHRRRLDGAPPVDLKFGLSLASISRIGQIFRGPRTFDPVLRFSIEDGLARVSQTGGLEGIVEASVAFPLVDGEFPNLPKIITNGLDSDMERADTVGVNSAFLADFQHAVTDATPLVIRMGGTDLDKASTRPLILTAGEDFIGLLMPVRFEPTEHSRTLTDWQTFLDPKPKRAPRKAAAKKQPPSKKAVA